MIITGTYNTATILTDNVEQEAIDQIKELCNQRFVENENIVIMPDCHAGAGCVIGYTQTLRNGYICPNLVGVDIACGMMVVELGKINIDLALFDEVVKANIPCGRKIRDGKVVSFDKITEMYAYRELPADTCHFVHRSLGTLGGGNHFIELDKDDEGNIYLVVHSGSRNIGKRTAEYYQSLANKLINHHMDEYFEMKDKIITEYKVAGRKSEIQSELIKLKAKYAKSYELIPYDLAYLSGKYTEMYLHDMKILHEFAHLNRLTIVNEIIKHYFSGSNPKFELWETFHNYIDFDSMILRKGAISAKKGERVIVPMNMRDGSLICIGKGNKACNESGPHGAGRLMSRTKAKESLSVEEFKKSMDGIYSSTVGEGTIDESPMAYKPMGEIIENIKPILDVERIIKPIYNFKAEESEPEWRKKSS